MTAWVCRQLLSSLCCLLVSDKVRHPSVSCQMCLFSVVLRISRYNSFEAFCVEISEQKKQFCWLTSSWQPSSGASMLSFISASCLSACSAFTSCDDCLQYTRVQQHLRSTFDPPLILITLGSQAFIQFYSSKQSPSCETCRDRQVAAETQPKAAQFKIISIVGGVIFWEVFWGIWSLI